MRFHMEDRRAYRIGIIAPAVWLLLIFASGLLGGAAQQMLRFGEGHGFTNPVSFFAAVSVLLSLLMIRGLRPRLGKGICRLG
jgi:hypothetical protein